VLRNELHPFGLEVVTVGLEMSGPDLLRPFVDAARPEHPSLVDTTHCMDARFGVTNIPQVVWIDEQGTIVRPPEPGSPAPQPTDDPFATTTFEFMLRGRPGPEWYGDRLRDWARRGADSEWAMSPDEVVAASRPCPPEVSRAAAHFELAQHLWRRDGFSDGVLRHFAQAHSLQPDNITYKRQAYSAYSYGKRADPRALFWQSPKPGEEDDWPFVSDFTTDMVKLRGDDWQQRGAGGTGTVD
jgi:hypothetical protein